MKTLLTLQICETTNKKNMIYLIAVYFETLCSFNKFLNGFRLSGHSLRLYCWVLVLDRISLVHFVIDKMISRKNVIPDNIRFNSTDTCFCVRAGFTCKITLLAFIILLMCLFIVCVCFWLENDKRAKMRTPSTVDFLHSWTLRARVNICAYIDHLDSLQVHFFFFYF